MIRQTPAIQRAATRLGRRLPEPAVLHWALLGTLFAALVAGAATFDRADWPSVVGDEATYLMQAESLAWDLDLTYSREDFDRFVRHRGMAPEGLILQKGEGSDRLVYGKPFFYALWSAPFVRISPTRGPFLANALLLALAAIAAARVLRPVVGPAAPSWAALLVFASVAFAHAFWAHLDLFLMCLAAVGLALVFGAREREPGAPLQHREALRYVAAGLLLAVVAYSRPFYLSLYLPALLAVKQRGSWRGVGALAAGTALLCVGALAVQQSLAGSWTSYGAERRSFYSGTGFPEVDLGIEEWDALMDRFGNAAWIKGRDWIDVSPGTARLWAWNLLYFAAGESVGLVPYFLPGLLGLLTWRARPPGAARWALLAAVALTAAGFFLLRPHNFYGGGGALANRYILPVYPALWFLPTRPLRLPWLVLVAALAGPFLWPLWTAPSAYPLTEHGLMRHVSPAARALLPYETTQSHRNPTGARVNVHHNGLWIKSLTPTSLWAEAGGRRLVFDPGRGAAELLLGTGGTLEAIHLEVDASALPLEVEGGEVTGRLDLGNGRQRLWVELEGPRARHPMWWTREDYPLYHLRLRIRDAAGRPPAHLTLAPAVEVRVPPG